MITLIGDMKMAQFYASIQGNRGTATRMGSKKSGMDGHIRGWSIGCRVWMRYNEETGQDECVVDLTRGSNRSGQDKRLGVFTTTDLTE